MLKADQSSQALKTGFGLTNRIVTTQVSAFGRIALQGYLASLVL